MDSLKVVPIMQGQKQNSQKANNVAFQRRRDYENPVSRSTEKGLAVLGGVATSAVLGTIAGGITSFIVAGIKENKGIEKTAAKDIKNFMKNNKIALLVGAGVAAVSLALTLPAKLYKTNVNSFVRQKEMDVFTRDRSLQANLTEEVDKEVQNPNVTLDKKLDDNLKLQMANQGNALGIANISS